MQNSVASSRRVKTLPFMRTFLLSSLALFATATTAQVVHFPMEVNNNQITEKCSNKTATVKGKLDAITVAGATGNALRTDGYSTYVEADVNSAAINGDAFTYEMWLAIETYPMMNIDENKNEYATIAGTLDDNAKTGFAFQLSNRGNWRFECYAGTGSEFNVEAPNLLPKYQWCHLVATVDNANKLLTLYLNGEQVAQKTPMRQGIKVGTSTMMIGKSREDITRDGFLLNTFNGIIDDIKVYDKVMTAAEIKTFSESAEVACGSAADLSVPSSVFANDPMRPHFHGMPSHGWTNESHGMTYYNGKYHVFFQKNGNGPYMSRLHWGHIVSEDLCSWTEVKTAVDPANAYDIKGCWSGCVVEDEAIFGNKPEIMYTGVDYAKAMISFATPEDEELLNWKKDSNNPRINGKPSGLSDDFRDPYFFRTENGAYIIVGSSNSKNVGCCTLHKYNNGNWESKGLFFEGTSKEQHGRFWEMPTVTKMGDGQWLFTCTPLDINGGVKVIYWVGSINADGKFVPTTGPKTVELSGMAKDGYCMLSPTIYQKDGKTLALGIVPDKIATAANAELGYAHCYSLPREWSLDEKGNLLQKPATQVLALRGTKKEVAELTGRQLEVKATFQVADNVGIELLKKGDKSAKITYNHSTKSFTIDFTELQGSCYPTKATYSSALPEALANDASITIDAWLDGSVLDVFINDKWATSVRVFCKDADANGVGIIGNATSVEAWELTSGTTAIEDVPVVDSASHSKHSDSARFVVEDGWVRLYNGTKRIF